MNWSISSFGVWLEDSFGLQIAALAGASAVIGLSELSGEGLVALLTDRIGKPRALVLGLSANAVTADLAAFYRAHRDRRADSRSIPVLHHV
jgi:predicted MFS family arabinose efflux permease